MGVVSNDEKSATFVGKIPKNRSVAEVGTATVTSRGPLGRFSSDSRGEK